MNEIEVGDYVRTLYGAMQFENHYGVSEIEEKEFNALNSAIKALKERQEDKERIKELERQCDIYEKDAIHFKKLYQLVRGDDMIEKSLVREKIKEVNNSNENYTFYKLTSADIRRTITTNLEELLEEGDDK